MGIAHEYHSNQIKYVQTLATDDQTSDQPALYYDAKCTHP